MTSDVSPHELLLRALDLQGKGQLDAAQPLFQQVLARDPGNAAALYSSCLVEHQRGNNLLAQRMTEEALQKAPGFALLHVLHGAILQGQGLKEPALKSYDAGLALDPTAVTALLNSGVLLRDMLRHAEALERFNRVVAQDPDNLTGLANCAVLLTEFKQSEQAIAMFQRLLEIKPDYDYGLGLLAYERLHICDWTDFEPLRQKMVAGVLAGQRACKSLSVMAFSDSAEVHFASARTFASHFCPPKPEAQHLWRGERYRHDKIRIAYVSPDLREHPVGHLICGVFEQHDKSRFETIAISLGIDDGSRLRGRMLKAFDHFIDVRGKPSLEIAQIMRNMEVDIAVDLGGYTSDTRSEVFAYRPAPVQVNYLGYPGTMGSGYYDYILADKQVIPVDQQRFYSERVAYLPDAYLPTDRSVQISPHTPTRVECGLPETGFVFCSFSHDYKISPPLFDIWMRLLLQVPGSVLWLMARGALAQGNLRKEAAARGVDPQRLVFAGRVPAVEDHLARYRQADLFLDTHPYNAHTTAADALMAGLPVLTYQGQSFPARVAGSLLTALDVPELITHSHHDYEALALHLATRPDALAAVRSKVQAHLDGSALFDTRGFCRGMEATYIAMWREAQLGLARDGLSMPLAGGAA